MGKDEVRREGVKSSENICGCSAGAMLLMEEVYGEGEEEGEAIFLESECLLGREEVEAFELLSKGVEG